MWHSINHPFHGLQNLQDDAHLYFFELAIDNHVFIQIKQQKKSHS